MNIEFLSSFERDLHNIRESGILKRVKNIIELVEMADAPHEIEQLKKLRGKSDYYRIKVGDYRIGLILHGDSFIFVRFLHRKDIYRYFP